MFFPISISPEPAPARPLPTNSVGFESKAAVGSSAPEALGAASSRITPRVFCFRKPSGVAVIFLEEQYMLLVEDASSSPSQPAALKMPSKAVGMMLRNQFTSYQ